MQRNDIRVGIGGWTYPPWRANFYPEGLPQKDELAYASRQVTIIEINGTYYRTQKRESFAKWRDETPSDFLFSVKASRYATNRKVLAEAGASIERFLGSGLSELGEKLGPILWQFAPIKRFDAQDFEGFLKLLPHELAGRKLRHVMDVRHDSFKTTEFLELLRRHHAAAVYADSDDYPSFADATADFVYARLMRAHADIATGYTTDALRAWSQRARAWAEGSVAPDLPRIEATAPAGIARDTFIVLINGAKERAPAAACELLSQLRRQ